MGLGRIFSNKAEFGNISSRPLSVSKVYQKTFINVDMKGTEAGSATCMYSCWFKLYLLGNKKYSIHFKMPVSHQGWVLLVNIFMLTMDLCFIWKILTIGFCLWVVLVEKSNNLIIILWTYKYNKLIKMYQI